MKNIFKKKVHLGVATSLVLIVITSLVATYFVFWLQPFPLWLMQVALENSGWVVVWLNFLPILLCMLLLYFALNSFVLSAGITGFVVVVLSVLNRFKIMFRHDPLTSWDFMLGAELRAISHSFSARLIYGTLGGFALVVAAIVLVAYFVRSSKIPAAWRMAGFGLSTAAALASANTVLANTELFDSLYVYGSADRAEDRFNSRGFMYAFIHTHLTSRITQPEGFDAALVREWIAEREPAAQQGRAEAEQRQHPHVLMILSEAFSEVSLSPGITFAHGYDPLENYSRL
ncbi:MAG: hypothetical protein FWD96_04730, partial [Defluviitaleaceae bacterium]|nr:hypothetical protein [Defluviitaleaceae bacterium]